MSGEAPAVSIRLGSGSGRSGGTSGMFFSMNASETTKPAALSASMSIDDLPPPSHWELMRSVTSGAPPPKAAMYTGDMRLFSYPHGPSFWCVCAGPTTCVLLWLAWVGVTWRNGDTRA